MLACYINPENPITIFRPGVVDEIMKGLTLQPMQEVDYNFPEDVKKIEFFLNLYLIRI